MHVAYKFRFHSMCIIFVTDTSLNSCSWHDAILDYTLIEIVSLILTQSQAHGLFSFFLFCLPKSQLLLM